VLVHQAQPFLQAVLAGHDAVLPGVVRAVGQPHAEDVAARLLHDRAALDHVGHGALTRPGVRAAQRAQLVLLVLEQVGVDRAQPDAQLARFLLEGDPVVRFVPRDVERDRRRHAGQPVDVGGIGQLLVNAARRAGPRKDFEAGAAVGIAPRGGFDGLRGQLALDAPHVDATGGQLVRQNAVGLRVVRHNLTLSVSQNQFDLTLY